MAAYIVVDGNVIDKEKLQRYSSLVPETLIPFQGEFVCKGPIKPLHGESDYQIKVIIGFPDAESAEGWYNSDAYQNIIPLRNEALDSKFHLIG